MPTDHTTVPVIPLRDGTGIPQLGFGTWPWVSTSLTCS